MRQPTSSCRLQTRGRVRLTRTSRQHHAAASDLSHSGGTSQHSPAAPSPTAAALPSAQMQPWECGHSQLRCPQGGSRTFSENRCVSVHVYDTCIISMARFKHMHTDLKRCLRETAADTSTSNTAGWLCCSWPTGMVLIRTTAAVHLHGQVDHAVRCNGRRCVCVCVWLRVIPRGVHLSMPGHRVELLGTIARSCSRCTSAV